MRILLDTCTYLWMLQDSPSLSSTARELLVRPGIEVYLSAVSLWEVLVKHGLGGLALTEPPEAFLRSTITRYNLTPLALDNESVWQLTRLPKHHRDPFDRMLVCQAIAKGLTIVTPDEQIHRYPVVTIW